jgi:predicted transcriptional regulator
VGGAKRTRKHRPWRMIGYVHGFRHRREALQFEWMLQNPTKSIRGRAALAKVKRGTLGTYHIRKIREVECFLTQDEGYTHLSFRTLPFA